MNILERNPLFPVLGLFLLGGDGGREGGPVFDVGKKSVNQVADGMLS